MLVIRLQRKGKKKQAFFRVVLQEKSWKTQGKALELLGFYNPRTKESKFQKERINFWIAKGAQPSPTVHNLFVDAKVIEGKKVKAWQPKKRKSTDLSDKASATAGASAKDGKKEVVEKTEVKKDSSTQAEEKKDITEVKDEDKTSEETPKKETKEVKEETKNEEPKKEEINTEKKEEVKNEAPVDLPAGRQEEKEPA